MLTKIRKILIIASLIVVTLIYADGQSEIESEIDKIIKESVKEETKREKREREKAEKAAKKKQKEEEKSKKSQEKEQNNNKEIEAEINAIINEANKERGITTDKGTKVTQGATTQNNTQKITTEKKVDNNVNVVSNGNVNSGQNVNQTTVVQNQNTVVATAPNGEAPNINVILEKNKQKNTKKVVIDKNKPVVIAEDREKLQATQYKETLIKYIATKDGTIIKKEQENRQHPVASLTKVMNIIVALDEIDKGNASLDDKVCFTPDIVNMGGSWLNAKTGDCFLLRDLLRSEIIYSANNAAYLVAKHIGKGNIDYFVELMNIKAKEIGMTNTKFYTPAGLPTSMTGKGMDVSTAYDLYLLGKKAIEDDRIKEWASEPALVILNQKGEQVVYNSRNHLLGEHGIFGLKTGFHELAGYNMIVTGKIGNIEVISVVLGHKSDNARTNDQREEFRNLENNLVEIYSAGSEMGKFKIRGAKKKKVVGIIAEDVYQLPNTNYEFKVKNIKLKAGKEGIKEGDVVGKLEVISEGKVISEVDILSTENVEQLSFIGKIIRFISFGLI